MTELNTSITIVAVLVLVILVVKLFRNGRRSERSGYTAHQNLLSKAERSFFGVLANAVGAEYIVVPKVRAADAITPRRGMSRSDWQRAFNRISAKHFDFVICQASDFRIVAAVELDDKTHKQSRRRVRDEFLETAAQGAGLPLLRFNAKSGYSQAQIRESFAGVVSQAHSVAEKDPLGRKEPVITWDAD